MDDRDNLFKSMLGNKMVSESPSTSSHQEPAQNTNQNVGKSDVLDMFAKKSKPAIKKPIKVETVQNASYTKLKNKLLLAERRNSENADNIVIQAAKHDDGLIAFCLARELSGEMDSLLKENLIQYVAYYKLLKKYYVFRAADRSRVERCLMTMIYRFSQFPVMYNFEDFQTMVSANDTNVIYIMDLSEYEAESIRRNMMSSIPDLKYTLFKVSDGTWGFGFFSEKVATNDSSSNADKSFLECYLKSTLLLNGEDSSAYINSLMSTVISDKAASVEFSSLLEAHPEIYLFNPNMPTYVVKILKDKYKRIKVNKDKATNAVILHEGEALAFKSMLGKLSFRKDMINMPCKDFLFSEAELKEKIQNWDKNAVKEANYVAYGKSQLARYVYTQFVENNSYQDWFGTNSMADVQIDEFKKEVQTVFEAVLNNKYPECYTRAQSAQLFQIVNKYEISVKAIKETIEKIGAINYTKEIEADRSIEDEITVCDILDQISVEMRNPEYASERALGF